jgi:hypothetical protein
MVFFSLFVLSRESQCSSGPCKRPGGRSIWSWFRCFMSGVDNRLVELRRTKTETASGWAKGGQAFTIHLNDVLAMCPVVVGGQSFLVTGLTVRTTAGLHLLHAQSQCSEIHSFYSVFFCLRFIIFFGEPCHKGGLSQMGETGKYKKCDKITGNKTI